VNICIRLIFPETRVTGLHFATDNMGLSSFKFVQWAPKDVVHNLLQKRTLLTH